jgi:hydroxymethylpyrimidine kinase/phosphomethylpyrimidine kinase
MGEPRPTILCIGGSDVHQGAGLQMDKRVVENFGYRFVEVVAVETIQSATLGLERALVRPLEDVADELLEALAEHPQAVKVGALGDVLLTEAVAEMLEPWQDQIPIVLDPVTDASRAKPGVHLNSEAGREALVQHLVPKATLVTPNRGEFDRAEEAYRAARACLLKGGHGDDPREVVDELLQPGEPPLHFRRPRLEGATEIHGTGCALAAALACLFAEGGRELSGTVGRALELMHAWLRDTIQDRRGALRLRPPQWIHPVE